MLYPANGEREITIDSVTEMSCHGEIPSQQFTDNNTKFNTNMYGKDDI